MGVITKKQIASVYSSGNAISDWIAAKRRTALAERSFVAGIT